MQELIEAVRKIDPEAAKYLESEYKDVEAINWVSGRTLIQIMHWANTPQGFDYWAKIHSQLPKKEGGSL